MTAILIEDKMDWRLSKMLKTAFGHLMVNDYSIKKMTSGDIFSRYIEDKQRFGRMLDRKQGGGNY